MKPMIISVSLTVTTTDWNTIHKRFRGVHAPAGVMDICYILDRSYPRCKTIIIRSIEEAAEIMWACHGSEKTALFRKAANRIFSKLHDDSDFREAFLLRAGEQSLPPVGHVPGSAVKAGVG